MSFSPVFYGLGAVCALMACWIYAGRRSQQMPRGVGIEIPLEEESIPLMGFEIKPISRQRTIRFGQLNKRKIADIILDSIRTDMGVHGNGIARIGSKEDAQLVKWMLDIKYISKSELEQAVHEALCLVGRDMFEWHQKIHP